MIAFAVGAVAGGSLVALMSSAASRQLLLMAQHTVQAEEDKQAIEAWAQGDFGAALGHAACSTSAMYGGAAQAFDPQRTRWSIGFPFMAPVLAWIMEPNLTPRGVANAQAASRAKLGAIWERLGKLELAEREYREAARLIGAENWEKLRDLGRELLDKRPDAPPPGR